MKIGITGHCEQVYELDFKFDKMSKRCRRELRVRMCLGRTRTGGKFWLGITLWAVIIIGESGLISQATLAMCVWAALFTLPFVYVSCQPALDALVDEAVSFASGAIQKGQILFNSITINFVILMGV